MIRPAEILEDLHLHGHRRNIRIYLHLSLQLLVVREDAIGRADTANALSDLSIAFTVDDQPVFDKLAVREMLFKLFDNIKVPLDLLSLSRILLAGLLLHGLLS